MIKCASIFCSFSFEPNLSVTAHTSDNLPETSPAGTPHSNNTPTKEKRKKLMQSREKSSSLEKRKKKKK